jgi:hypothetical protein
VDRISHDEPMPLLEAWRAEVGDEAITEAVARARGQISDGQIPSLTDNGELRGRIVRPS